jgi:hypothetical protein
MIGMNSSYAPLVTSFANFLRALNIRVLTACSGIPTISATSLTDLSESQTLQSVSPRSFFMW